MHFVTDSVAHKFFHNAKSGILGLLNHNLCDIGPPFLSPHFSNGNFQHRFTHFEKTLLERIDCPNCVCPGCVATPSVQPAAGIDTDDVTFLQPAFTRDTVHDLFID